MDRAEVGRAINFRSSFGCVHFHLGGRVEFLNCFGTRTLKARVEVANPAGQLVPGMFASIRFSSAARKDVLLVPSEAVIQTGARNVVMVAQGEGRFAPVDVEIGSEANGQSEILKGLEAGQQVVVSGQFLIDSLIDSEASLRGTATRMSGPAPEGSKASEGPVHHGEGKVEKIDKDEITLSHGPIPTLQWGPMTMGFKLLPASGLPADVAVGSGTPGCRTKKVILLVERRSESGASLALLA